MRGAAIFICMVILIGLVWGCVMLICCVFDEWPTAARRSALCVKQAQKTVELMKKHGGSFDSDARFEINESIRHAEKIPAWLRGYYLRRAVEQLQAEEEADEDRARVTAEIVERMVRRAGT